MICSHTRERTNSFSSAVATGSSLSIREKETFMVRICSLPASSLPLHLCSSHLIFLLLHLTLPVSHSPTSTHLPFPSSIPTFLYSLLPPFLLSSHLVIWQSSLRTSLCNMGLPLRRLNSTSSWIKFCCTSGCLVWGVSERALRSVIQCSVAAEEHPKHLP